MKEKRGWVIPGLKRRFPARVPSMHMHNKQQAFIEHLILENQELRDRVTELENGAFSREWSNKLLIVEQQVKDLEAKHHTH